MRRIHDELEEGGLVEDLLRNIEGRLRNGSGEDLTMVGMLTVVLSLACIWTVIGIAAIVWTAIFHG